MTVAAASYKYHYTGNGSSTVFAGPVAHTASQIDVYLNAVLQSTGFTITNVDGVQQVTVTFSTAPGAGVAVDILRDVDYAQTFDITNQGAYLPEAHEKALDAIVFQTAQLGGKVSASVRLPDTYSGAASTVLPLPSALKAIRWNAAGTALELFDPSGAQGPMGPQGPQGPAGADGVGSGTVTSVALSMPSIMSVSGSPVTSSGTLTATLASQSANLVFASPNGSSGAPTFRKVAIGDVDATGTPSSSTYLRGDGAWASPAGSGTVTSVGLSLPSELSVSGSPVTGSGTLSGVWVTQTQAKVFASPASSTGAPSFRALVAGDIPTLNQNTTGSAAKWTTSRTFTIGATGKSVDGTAAVSWTLGEIGAAPFRLAVTTANATTTLASGHLNGVVEKSNTTAYTYTLAASLGEQGDAITIVNSGTAGDVTIARDSGVSLYQGGTDKNVTVGPGSMVTLYRTATSNRWVC